MKSNTVGDNEAIINVAPFAGAWIEIIIPPGKPLEHLSLPSRERGLKFYDSFDFAICNLSLPSRERGLKYEIYQSIFIRHESLPSRERGLKCPYTGNVHTGYSVAPFAGAWIEILNAIALAELTYVAPFAGAWIEIHAYRGQRNRATRRSLRGSVD